MSYDSEAQKKFGARSCWLFEVSTSGVTERFCSRLRSLNFAGQTWLPAAVSRPDINRDKHDKTTMSVTFPHSSTVATAALEAAGSSSVTVKVWHVYTTDVAEEKNQAFIGSVEKVFPRWFGIKLLCSDESRLMARRIVGRVIQKTCPYALFSPACGLVRAAHQDSLELTVINGLTLTIPDASLQADGYYDNGNLEYNGEAQIIESHVGSTVVLAGPLLTLGTPPFNVLLSRACTKTPASCLSFSNDLNYGGFEAINESPYDGRSIV